jgi:uncharacterized protein (TIGR02466 family)
MNKPAIYPLFSTPLYVNNVGDFEKPNLKALEYSSSNATAGSYNFRSSVDKRVLDRPEFKRVHDVIMKEIELYTRELLAVNSSIEFYITNSRVNVHRRGQSAGSHVHHNSLISGVLYLKTTETSGDLVFHRDVLSLVPFPPALDLDMNSFNIYNCKSWSYRPKTNDICLFPSVVSHSVEPNESDEERWCLAFNVFVRGDFGLLHELSIK